MTRKKLLVALALALVVGVVVVLKMSGKPAQSDEQILLGLIDRMTTAAEQRNIKEMRRHLSKSYRDDRGLDYKQINSFLLVHFLRKGLLSVYVLRKSAQVDGRTATMKVTAALTRSPKVKNLSDLVPSSLRALTFDLSFVKEKEQWKLVSARRKSAIDWRRLLSQ